MESVRLNEHRTELKTSYNVYAACHPPDVIEQFAAKRRDCCVVELLTL